MQVDLKGCIECFKLLRELRFVYISLTASETRFLAAALPQLPLWPSRCCWSDLGQSKLEQRAFWTSLEQQVRFPSEPISYLQSFTLSAMISHPCNIQHWYSSLLWGHAMHLLFTAPRGRRRIIADTVLIATVCFPTSCHVPSFAIMAFLVMGNTDKILCHHFMVSQNWMIF